MVSLKCMLMGASGNFLTAVGRVTSRGARVKEIAASGDAAYNQNAVTGGSLNFPFSPSRTVDSENQT
jgi:hypothetical protein